jgi:hypothetical protein
MDYGAFFKESVIQLPGRFDRVQHLPLDDLEREEFEKIIRGGRASVVASGGAAAAQRLRHR